MAVEVVKFQPDDESQKEVISILEDALSQAKEGRLIDVAVVGAVIGDNGPELYKEYWAGSQYGLLLAATSWLEFDLHFQRYMEDE